MNVKIIFEVQAEKSLKRNTLTLFGLESMNGEKKTEKMEQFLSRVKTKNVKVKRRATGPKNGKCIIIIIRRRRKGRPLISEPKKIISYKRPTSHVPVIFTR